MNTPPKTYLGDSVYAEIENGMLKLTTNNGQGPSNTIFLEFPVYVALTQYVQQLSKPPRQPDPEPPAEP